MAKRNRGLKIIAGVIATAAWVWMFIMDWKMALAILVAFWMESYYKLLVEQEVKAEKTQ